MSSPAMSFTPQLINISPTQQKQLKSHRPFNSLQQSSHSSSQKKLQHRHTPQFSSKLTYERKSSLIKTQGDKISKAQRPNTMWKSLISRRPQFGPRFGPQFGPQFVGPQFVGPQQQQHWWPELVRRTVSSWNPSSSWQPGNPNCRVVTSPGQFRGAATSPTRKDEGSHGGSPDAGSRRASVVRLLWCRNRSGTAGVGHGRRVDVGEEAVAEVGFRIVVNDVRVLAKEEELLLYEEEEEEEEDEVVAVGMPLGVEEILTMLHGGGGGGSVAVDMEQREGAGSNYKLLQHDGGEVLVSSHKLAAASRFKSDVAAIGTTPRLVSQRNPRAGIEYRRRRTISDFSRIGGNGPHRQGSLREFTHKAASETFLITRLAITLLKLLGIGTRWFTKFIRLSLYAGFLMPGFIQVGFFYYFDSRVHRSVVYGDQPRNRLDLYLPPDSDKPKPVVIFITGGAWIIGYKAWGALLAQQLVERDIIVACLDYRNFPQGCISDMISDVSTGIGYVYQNVESFGGDPDMVYLAGQSAGAHLAACALLMQAEKEVKDDPSELSWRSSQMKAYLAISGGYNLIKLVEYFHTRGLYKTIMLRVMEGEKSLRTYSPEFMVQTPAFKKAVPLLPPITLFHGTGDYSIPHEASVAFAIALQSVGARVNTVFFPDKTHTDLFLQDPMRGGKDELLADILAIIHANDEEARADDVKYAYSRRRLVPEFLLQLARSVSPF